MMDAMLSRVEAHLARARTYEARLIEAHRIKSLEIVRLRTINARQQLRIIELEERLSGILGNHGR